MLSTAVDNFVDNFSNFWFEGNLSMDNTILQAKWQEVIAKLHDDLADGAIKRWISKPIEPISYADGTLTLQVAGQMYKASLENKYIGLLQTACNAVFGEDVAFSLDVIDQAKSISDDKEGKQVTEAAGAYEVSAKSASEGKAVQGVLIDTADTNTSSAPVTSHKPEMIAPGDKSTLIPKYTFDALVKGSYNEMAYAVAEAVAKDPGQAFNPFFMYGGVGLGKTHLMHAIGHQVLKSDPTKRVLYITSERFTNELINSIRDNSAEAFRQKYRNIDVLLVDDIQFLDSKPATQEEFFHTFNTLKDHNKAIVLSSDRLPKDIQTLEDRLRSRFEGGMLADIQKPDLETRVAILRKKAHLENLDVPDNALMYIAGRIDSNVRELEGALTRVMAYSSLTNQKITTDLVASALQNLYPDSKTKEITIQVIQEIVAGEFNLKVEDLLSKKRTKNLTVPRQIAMYLSRELTNTSLPQIGKLFGGKDHTTVIHAYEKISKERQTDTKMNDTVKNLIAQIDKL